MKQKEIELKNLLTSEEYHQLVQAFCSPEEQAIVQTNYYYDAHDILKHHRYALRIRMMEHSSEGEITLKIPINEIETLEYTHTLARQELEVIAQSKQLHVPTSLQEVLTQHGITQTTFHEIGRLTTHRHEIPIIEQAILVLDKSYYRQTVDFELEIEASHPSIAQQELDRILSTFSIPKRKTRSKIARALSAE